VGGRVQAHHRRRGGGGDNGGSGGEDSAGRRIQQQLLTRVAELEGGLASAQLTPAQVAAEVLSHFERSYQPAVSKLSAQIEGFGLRIQVCGMIVSIGPPCLLVRVRAEIMGAPKCRNVGESQYVLIMTEPMISTRTAPYQMGYAWLSSLARSWPSGWGAGQAAQGRREQGLVVSPNGHGSQSQI
jgi:hypothetical protein